MLEQRGPKQEGEPENVNKVSMFFFSFSFLTQSDPEVT